jgi:steroid delta-isomerase-like uncharacterized protein
MPEEAKELARRFIAVFDSGDTAALDKIVADDVIDHNPLPGTGTGRQGIADAVAIYRGAFPDLSVRLDRLVGENDYVAATGTATGTNTGQLRGAPPTGRQATFAYLDMYRCADGRIVECWHLEDIAGMLGQLGLLPQ